MQSIRRYGHVPAVGRRQCRGSGVDGEGLMKAAQVLYSAQEITSPSSTLTVEVFHD
jgi:hypothetical protein